MLTVMAPTASGLQSISASISGTQESGTQQTISMISHPTIYQFAVVKDLNHLHHYCVTIHFKVSGEVLENIDTCTSHV